MEFIGPDPGALADQSGSPARRQKGGRFLQGCQAVVSFLTYKTPSIGKCRDTGGANAHPGGGRMEALKTAHGGQSVKKG